MKSISWGWRVMIAFIIFTFGTASWVAYAMTTTVDLVRDDYYEHGLKHDETMRERARGLASGASIEYDRAKNFIEIIIPHQPALKEEPAIGSLTLYRPNSVSSDRMIPLSLTNNDRISVPVKDLARGVWHMTLSWKEDGKNFELVRIDTI